MKEGDKVVIVEDLISTGRSSLVAVNAVRAAGCIVKDVVAIFTYDLDTAIKGFEEDKCNLHSLTNFNTLLGAAVSMGQVSVDDAELARKWQSDPQNWGDKYAS